MERRRLDTSSEFGPKVVFVRLLHVGTASQVSRRGRGILIRSKTIQERLSHTIHSNPSSPCKQRSFFWNIRCHVLLLLRHLIIIQFRFKGPSVRVCVCGMKTTISHFNHMRAVLLVNHTLISIFYSTHGRLRSFAIHDSAYYNITPIPWPTILKMHLLQFSASPVQSTLGTIHNCLQLTSPAKQAGWMNGRSILLSLYQRRVEPQFLPSPVLLWRSLLHSFSGSLTPSVFLSFVFPTPSGRSYPYHYVR